MLFRKMHNKSLRKILQIKKIKSLVKQQIYEKLFAYICFSFEKIETYLIYVYYSTF